jgi:hypothetical protein
VEELRVEELRVEELNLLALNVAQDIMPEKARPAEELIFRTR